MFKSASDYVFGLSNPEPIQPTPVEKILDRFIGQVPTLLTNIKITDEEQARIKEKFFNTAETVGTKALIMAMDKATSYIDTMQNSSPSNNVTSSNGQHQYSIVTETIPNCVISDPGSENEFGPLITDSVTDLPIDLPIDLPTVLPIDLPTVLPIDLPKVSSISIYPQLDENTPNSVILFNTPDYGLYNTMYNMFRKPDISFITKFNLMTRLRNLVGKKTLKVLVIGPTMHGKSSTLKYLFNIEKMDIGNGIKSNTSLIHEHIYTQNGVDLIVVDAPGFFDTEGRSDIFYKSLLDYIKKNDKCESTKIDIILWVSKLGDIPNAYVQGIMTKLTGDLGSEFWKKIIVVLTNANSTTPPQEYYDNATIILNCISDGTMIDNYGNLCNYNGDCDNLTYKEQREILAWKLYVALIKQQWKKYLSKYNDDIDVVMVENNREVNGSSENGEGRLKDGTLIVETFYNSLFSLLAKTKTDKSIVASTFIFLSGSIEYEDIDSKYEDPDVDYELTYTTNIIDNLQSVSSSASASTSIDDPDVFIDSPIASTNSPIVSTDTTTISVDTVSVTTTIPSVLSNTSVRSTRSVDSSSRHIGYANTNTGSRRQTINSNFDSDNLSEFQKALHNISFKFHQSMKWLSDDVCVIF